MAEDLPRISQPHKRRDDARIEEILDVIYRFANGDLKARGSISSGESLLDGVMAGINVLGEELEAYMARQRQTEEELRAASLYARSLIEASLDPLLTIDVAGRIMDANEAAVLATGVPRAQLIGSEFSSWFIESDRSRAAYEDVFGKGAIRNYPLTLKHLSGRLTEVFCNASVYLNEKGEVAGVCVEARDMTDRRRAERAEELARHDGLTGLYNHSAFYSLLKDELERAQRYNRPVSLLMIDIDEFKRVNDTHGHRAGDAILETLGPLLTAQARASDRVCRYGGEELAVILPETDWEVAMLTAGRLRGAVEDQAFKIDGEVIGITISIGVATYPQQVDSTDGLVEAADLALYAAKEAGRNRVCQYQGTPV